MKKVNVTKMLFVLMTCFFGISQAEVVEWYEQNESGPSWQCESFPNDGDETQSAMYKAYDKNGPAFISLKSDPTLSESITGTK